MLMSQPVIVFGKGDVVVGDSFYLPVMFFFYHIMRFPHLYLLHIAQYSMKDYF